MKKNNKLILQYIKDNKTKEYKSMMALSKDFPDVNYSQLREIYLMSTGKTKRKFNASLYENIRIIDNPEYYKSFIQSEALPEVVAECVEPLFHHQQYKEEEIQVLIKH
jgi:hypothetical protein